VCIRSREWYSYIPSNEVRRDPVVAESIFCVIEVVTSTGLPIKFGSAGMSSAPLPDGESILSCGCPCVCSDAILCLSILSSFCCSTPANAGSYLIGPKSQECVQSGMLCCGSCNAIARVVRLYMRWN
jgi:hypothetical protein